MTTAAMPSPGPRIAVVGAGYVGLPTSAVLAHFGHRVVCAERDERRLADLVAGRMPIVEEGLVELVRSGVEAGRLRFVRTATEAVRGASYVFVCVPTPELADGSADLSFVQAVAAEIGPHLAPGAVVVNKSTVPVGTALFVERVTGRRDITVVSNPEFLREGSAVHDSLHPDRVVVGSDDRAAARRVAELFAATGAPMIVTDTVSAETIKYASNAFLATKLSFVNALANLCESVGADVDDVVLGVGHDHRVGSEFLHPGPGWGGSCLPKDTRALIRMADEAGYDFALLRAAVAANEEHRGGVVAKVVRAATGRQGLTEPGGTATERTAAGELTGVTVAVWGLAFKARTDDRRASPAIAVARALVDLGATVRAFDPTVSPGSGSALAAGDLGGLVLCDDAYEACRQARAVAVLTEWEDLRALDFVKVRDLMARPAVVDARNLLDPVALRGLGFEYTGVGRP